MKNLIDEVEHYFELFSQKDLEGVSRKFSDDIFVQDWDIYAQGKEKVIEVNKGIFDSVDTVSVSMREFYQQDLVTICLIDVEGSVSPSIMPLPCGFPSFMDPV